MGIRMWSTAAAAAAAGGALALACLPACARAQEQGEGDVAAEEEAGEETGKNSSVAKSVEVGDEEKAWLVGGFEGPAPVCARFACPHEYVHNSSRVHCCSSQ